MTLQGQNEGQARFEVLASIAAQQLQEAGHVAMHAARPITSSVSYTLYIGQEFQYSWLFRVFNLCVFMSFFVKLCRLE